METASLAGEFKDRWAVSVSGSWRLTFRFEGEDAVLVDYQDYHRRLSYAHAQSTPSRSGPPRISGRNDRIHGSSTLADYAGDFVARAKRQGRNLRRHGHPAVRPPWAPRLTSLAAMISAVNLDFPFEGSTSVVAGHEFSLPFLCEPGSKGVG